MASFKKAEILLKHKKPFENGEIWKESSLKQENDYVKNLTINPKYFNLRNIAVEKHRCA